MTISYPLSTPPSPGIKNVRFTPMSVVSVSESPFTLQNQVQGFPGQRWQVEITLPSMVRADAEQWIAFLLSLNGKFGTFLFGDPAGKQPRGSALGTPVVDGPGQIGNSLETTGWDINETGVLLKGDYIELGTLLFTRLYKVLNDVDADGSGNADIDIWPSLQVSPPASDPLVLSQATGLFRLSSNEMPYNINDAVHYGIVIAAMSVV